MAANRKSVIAKARETLLKLKTELTTYWNKPHEGEYISYKQLLSFYVGTCGLGFFHIVTGLLVFAAGFFCGSIMGIEVKDFVTIGAIGMVANYVFIFLAPFNMLVYENHGNLRKKEKKSFYILMAVKFAVGLAAYFVPSRPFDGIIRGFPQLIGNTLCISCLFDLLNYLIRKKFCAKHGRVKPFVVLYAIPTVIVFSLIPWIPYGADYKIKLVLLHAVFSFGNNFNAGFQNINGIVNFMSQNTQERQRIFSFNPIINSILYSLLNIFLPWIIDKGSFFGTRLGGYESLYMYRVLVPLVGIVSLVFALPFLFVKENLIEQKIDRPNVRFFDGAKKIFQNKYFWIYNVATLLGAFAFMINKFINFYFIYVARETWMVGLVYAVVAFGSTIGNAASPSFTKRFDRRTILIYSRIAFIAISVAQIFTILYLNIILYCIVTFFQNIVNQVYQCVVNGVMSDVLDYHQWKTGERADAISGIFGWFTSPVTTAIAYIAPLVYRMLGFTSDWGVFYDERIFINIFLACQISTTVAALLSMIPYCFYDLSRKTHKECIREIRARVERADKLAFCKHVQDGTWQCVTDIQYNKLKEYGVDMDTLFEKLRNGETLILNERCEVVQTEEHQEQIALVTAEAE